ncbi:MAG: branched-chain amino acid ABC transporter permease [Treponema sp. GWB1_62_6]|nr:MAG: branched-chain amino acid ABC transporter permease [Treponema sp. GWC1_61_84]OHE71883.1 MAG: branched-chain amino acid ABC transporter permease [Treponema sp. RIFOXYC1_FULL_61_9]OHE72218.1 MAG: branched-chain amino acid ABC transporter permease [Treponema sp. GWB1_62_6]HCM28612.1 branched-chain amino acid ABC transporter permease [Treponema sp.]
MSIKPYLPVIALAVCAFLLPPVLTAAKSAFYLTQLTMSAYYALASLGLCALMGYAGQISLGQAGFFAIGGYASSFIATRNLQAIASSPLAKALDLAGLLSRGTDPYGVALLSLSPWVSCILAVLLAAAVAALIGMPVLKLKGHYLAMATLGFGLVIEKVVRGTKALGAADGLSNVPGFPILPGLVVTGGKAARASNFTISWVVLALALLALVNLFRSRAGRALRALHDGEEAAGANGVDTSRYKLNVFILGAVFAAVAGVLLTHYNGSIGPGEANVMKSVRYVAIVSVGGMANLTGTLIAGLLLNFLSLRGIFGSLDDAVFGIVLIFVMMLAPEGKAFGHSFSSFLRRKGRAG